MNSMGRRWTWSTTVWPLGPIRLGGRIRRPLRLLEGHASGLPAVTVWLAFSFWIAVLSLTLWGLFPRRWRVQCDAVGRPPGEAVRAPLTAAELFEAGARFKYPRLAAAEIQCGAAAFPLRRVPRRCGRKFASPTALSSSFLQLGDRSRNGSMAVSRWATYGCSPSTSARLWAVTTRSPQARSVSASA
jgi:hypothetical protein